MQSGTFDLRRSASSGDSVWNYPDTVVIDAAVKVIGFTEVWNDRRVSYAGGRRYWIFLENNVELERTTVAYALSDSASVTFGPVSLRPSAQLSSRAPRAGLVWSGKDAIQIRDACGALYNLRGERLSAPRVAVFPKH